MRPTTYNKVEVPEGYFQFSTPQDEKYELDEWEKWFEIKGFKTIIKETPNGKWVLFREGRDANDESAC